LFALWSHLISSDPYNLKQPKIAMDFYCHSGVDHALYFTPPSTPDDIHGDSNTPPGELLHQATFQQKTGEDEICDLPLVQEDVNELCK
jgi:hypothetical protein